MAGAVGAGDAAGGVTAGLVAGVIATDGACVAGFAAGGGAGLEAIAGLRAVPVLRDGTGAGFVVRAVVRAGVSSGGGGR